MSEAREDAVAHKPDGLWPALVAGAAASAVSRAITYPPDLVKAQLQIQGLLGHHGQHSLSTLQLSRQIANAEGAAGFYRGFGAVLAGVVPATMVYYAAYETSKKYVPDELGPLKGMTVGLMTQLAAGLAFTPVDIIKERMQAQRLMRHAYSYTGPAHAAASILRSQGWQGFGRGLGARVVTIAPGAALQWFLYETIKSSLD
ncbi:hypothetical protein WJX84_009739 [Apatococcus fuscideae]|uniref:Mitochondrial carrier protein n=1 Tax=Apatococcus fuscideae TaxID=2026836 RepID=A0AAW1SR39_9CHLO